MIIQLLCIIYTHFGKTTSIFQCVISFDLDLLFRQLMPLNVQNFMKYYLREVRFLQLESMKNSQTIFGYFRTFSKNDLKLQKSVAMVLTFYSISGS